MKTSITKIFQLDYAPYVQKIQLHTRPEMIIEISCLLHMLIVRGTNIAFCWIPSHSFFYFNEKVDRAAKRGAMHSCDSVHFNFPLSIQEQCSIVNSHIWEILNAV